MKLFLYFSSIIDMDIIDAQGDWVGGLHDIAMNPVGDIYPKATGLVIRRGALSKEFAYIPWEEVTYIEEEVRLKAPGGQLTFAQVQPKCDFTLRRDILDQQVVDTDDQRVVRVNDLHLLRVENQLYAAHVDVGLRALVRRLEWTGMVDLLVRLCNRKSPYLTQEELISWKNTQILPKLGRKKNVVKLDVSRSKLAAIPPAALAEIMDDLDIFARVSLFKSLDFLLQQKVFADMSLTHKEELIEKLEEQEVAAILASIPADEATDILMHLPRAKAHQFMRLMGSEASKKLRSLLAFAKDSAGGLMSTEYIVLKAEATVADAIQKIKDNVNSPGNIYFLYVVDENYKYLGTTSVRRFINEPPEKKLIDTCYQVNAYAYTDDGMEEVALLLERYKFSSLPVLDHNDILQGAISIDDVMEELISLVWGKYKERL